MDAAVEHALNRGMHYCINFKAIPNQNDAVEAVREELKSRSMYLKQLTQELENENCHIAGLSNVASQILKNHSANKLDHEIAKMLESKPSMPFYYNQIKGEGISEIDAETSRSMSEVDPLEKRFGVPQISPQVEEGKLIMPESDQIKQETRYKTRASCAKQQMINYLDMPLPGPRDDDTLSSISRNTGGRSVGVKRKTKRNQKDIQSAANFEDMKEHLTQLGDIDQWDRQSYVGPTNIQNDIFALKNRMRLQDQFETLSRMSMPDVGEVMKKYSQMKIYQLEKRSKLRHYQECSRHMRKKN